MKIAAISDTHGYHKQLIIPKCDVLVHAGDYSSYGRWEDTIDFLNWFDNQPAKYKILVSGNHDSRAMIEPSNFMKELLTREIIYLEDDDVIIKGIKFYGSPWTVPFNDWYFMMKEEDLKEKYSLIPLDTDVLITHGPQKGILDRTYFANGDCKGNWGSKSLSNYICDSNIKHHIFGHLHADGGQAFKTPTTTHYNVAVCDEQYKVTREPRIIEI